MDNLILDEIVEIVELDEEETLDIEVTGNNLFFANDILTHNSGYHNSDIDATNMSESMGTVMTADVVWAVMQTEELAEQNQFLFKQLKNRFSDIGKYSKFIVGVDKSKMRIFDVEESAQDDLDKGLLADTPSPGSKKDFSMFR